MFGNKSNNRFETIHKERTGTSGCNVIVDRETGVHYLFSWYGNAGGMTPLLDKDGKPVIQIENS